MNNWRINMQPPWPRWHLLMRDMMDADQAEKAQKQWAEHPSDHISSSDQDLDILTSLFSNGQLRIAFKRIEDGEKTRY
jgi:hypothetical protein